MAMDAAISNPEVALAVAARPETWSAIARRTAVLAIHLLNRKKAAVPVDLEKGNPSKLQSPNRPNPNQELLHWVRLPCSFSYNELTKQE
jgi:hypothetical protein